MNVCQCADKECPVHPGYSDCENTAKTGVHRIDMEDVSGTPMCLGCAQDAVASGVFRYETVREKVARTSS